VLVLQGCRSGLAELGEGQGCYGLKRSTQPIISRLGRKGDGQKTAFEKKARQVPCPFDEVTKYHRTDFR